MKYKIDTYEDFLKLKPVEVSNIFENFELYTDEEMNNLMNFVAQFENSIPENEAEFALAAENTDTNIFENYTNNELLNGFLNKK